MRRGILPALTTAFKDTKGNAFNYKLNQVETERQKQHGMYYLMLMILLYHVMCFITPQLNHARQRRNMLCPIQLSIITSHWPAAQLSLSSIWDTDAVNIHHFCALCCLCAHIKHRGVKNNFIIHWILCDLI